MDAAPPPTIQAWENVVRTRDPALLSAILADEVVFESPVVHTPQAGKPITMAYLGAALQVLNTADFRILRHWYAPSSAVLEFETRVDGLTVNGIDMIDWDPQGRIVRFKVMIRPLKAIHAVHQAMAAQLSQQTPGR